VFQLVLLTVLTTLLYALHTWEVFVKREQDIRGLRPFVASEHLYDRLLDTPTSTDDPQPGAAPFAALCRDVLGTRVGYLLPVGRLGDGAPNPLIYAVDPENLPPLPNDVEELGRRFASPQTLGAPLEPDHYPGLVWAIPLWGAGRLSGLLLLGEKEEASLYTQEEIEIARAAGERLIDLQASADIGRRLIQLQRQRLAESQLLDSRARRVLHDEVAPRLHTALLVLAAAENGLAGPAREAADQITAAHRAIADLLHDLPTTAAPDIARLGLIGALRQEVTNQLGSELEVKWDTPPDAESAIAELAPLQAEIVFGAAREALRNAARHGRGPETASPLRVSIHCEARNGLRVSIEDEGVGMVPTAEPGGTGQGLSLHRTLMAVVGGALTVESAPHGGTRVLLTLPVR
jgi:signal transduction histidine kinase